MTDMLNKNETADQIERYSSIFNNSHTPMLVIDNNNGNIIDGNLAALKYYGYSLEELKSLNISSINILSKHEISAQMGMAVSAGGGYFQFTHRLSSGELREVEVYSGPITVMGKSCLLSIVHDTQYKKELERNIQMQTSYFKSLYEHSPEGIAMFDLEFKIVNVNKSFERMFQYTLEEIKFKNITDVICDETSYNESSYIKDCIKRGEFVRQELQRRRKDGKLLDISFLGYPIIFDGEQIGVYAIYTDLTKAKEEIRAREEELHKARIKAEEANKFKTQFIANVAHEIRTPMNGIVGIIDLMEDTELSNEYKGYFQMLRYSAERLSKIINNVMDIAKIETGKLDVQNECFNLKKLLRDVEKYFRIQARKKALEFSLSINPRLPDILIGDADKLNQVLFNLISNAIKFTEHGQIHVEVQSEANAMDNSIRVEFSVGDTGIGIPKEKLNSIFEDFVQIDSSITKKYEGAGLGLAISRKLVELMGGTIGAVSKCGKGSVFSFDVLLEIADDAEKRPKTALDSESNQYEMLAGLKVLVIEDENINQKILKEVLEKKKCSVTIASNGRETLRILDKQIFDLILMDIYMPEMDGVQLTKIIREREKASGVFTPIIAVTAAIMNSDKAIYYAAGINDCIAKPFEREQLYRTVSSVISRKMPKNFYNLEPILDTLDGNYSILEDIINEFTSEEYQQDLLGRLEKFIRDEDYDNISKQLHKIKGSVSHFKLKSFDIILAEAKESCLKRDIDSLTKQALRLKNEYKSFSSFAQEYIKQVRD